MRVATSPPSPTKDAATDPPAAEAEYINTDILKEWPIIILISLMLLSAIYPIVLCSNSSHSYQNETVK